MKKLTRHGNSWALVIDKPVLDLLKIDPAQTQVEMTTDGRSLLVSPVRDGDRRTAFEAAMARSDQKFGRLYKRLA
ncbi:MAG TPA: AbrB/MazE/SpoVT family DNA-binding domain-containing protein, partial [Candidatus Limnocylindria bacterium]